MRPHCAASILSCKSFVVVFDSYLVHCSEIDKLDLEDESSVGWDNATGTCGTVAEGGRNGELGLLTLGELGDALVPSLDDLADTEHELNGLSTGDAGVKDLTILQGASVVDLDLCAGLGLGATISLAQKFDVQTHYALFVKI